MKAVLFAILFSLGVGSANSAFVPATWDYNTPNVPIQESFVTLYAVGAQEGPQTFGPFLSPSVLNLSNGGFAEKAQIEAELSFLPGALGIDLTRLERRERDTSTNVQGAFVFSVTEPTKTVASGYLSLLSPGISTENGLLARLFNYTTQEFLFQSSQYDAGSDKTYLLGGNVGNRISLFSGSLENTLLAGNIYRFDYLLQTGNSGSGDFGSSAIGAFSLNTVSAVPEPETFALMLAGLGLMGVIARRRKAKQTA